MVNSVRIDNWRAKLVLWSTLLWNMSCLAGRGGGVGVRWESPDESYMARKLIVHIFCSYTVIEYIFEIVNIPHSLSEI